jgi:hypothetical protein
LESISCDAVPETTASVEPTAESPEIASPPEDEVIKESVSHESMKESVVEGADSILGVEGSNVEESEMVSTGDGISPSPEIAGA